MVSYLPSWVVSADEPNNFNFQSICSESKYKIPRELDTDSIVLEFEHELLLKGSVKKILILGLVGLCDAILTSSLRSRENKDLTAIAGSEYGSRIYISNSASADFSSVTGQNLEGRVSFVCIGRKGTYTIVL